MLTISEVYPSLQGEGRLTGTPSVLVRTSGCNLRCHFCDTPFTSWEPTGELRSVEAVVDDVLRHELSHVIVTGGEPLIVAEIGALLRALAGHDLHLTVETAGTRFREVACDLMSISPKLSNSTPSVDRSSRWAKLHETRRHRPDVVAKFLTRYDCQLKFVIEQPDDLTELEGYLTQLRVLLPGPVERARLDETVWLMPQGIDATVLADREHWLGPLCEQRGWKLCHRKHIEWFGHRRGT